MSCEQRTRSLSPPLICVLVAALLIQGEKWHPAALSSRRRDAPVTCHTLWSTLVSVFLSPTSCQLPLLRCKALSPGGRQQTAEAPVTQNSGWICLPNVSRRDISFSTLTPILWTVFECDISYLLVQRIAIPWAIVEGGQPHWGGPVQMLNEWCALMLFFPPSSVHAFCVVGHSVRNQTLSDLTTFYLNSVFFLHVNLYERVLEHVLIHQNDHPFRRQGPSKWTHDGQPPLSDHRKANKQSTNSIQ